MGSKVRLHVCVKESRVGARPTQDRGRGSTCDMGRRHTAALRWGRGILIDLLLAIKRAVLIYVCPTRRGNCSFLNSWFMVRERRPPSKGKGKGNSMVGEVTHVWESQQVYRRRPNILFSWPFLYSYNYLSVYINTHFTL